MARTKKPTDRPAEARARKPSGKHAALPVAPVPAATLIGPQTAKLPARPARAKPPPLPRSATAPADAAKLRAALDAVLAAPSDDAPRLAYAELLRSAGDPRGEFITVGLELGRHGDRNEREDPATKPLWDTFRSVHARSAAKWTKGLKALGKQTRWRWRRGFVHELRINGWEAGCTPGNLAAVLAREPVAELLIDGGDEDLLARLLAVRGIERVQRLGVSGWDARTGGAFVGRVLGRSKRLTGVVELRAGIKLGDPGVLPLLDADALANVVHLALGLPEASPETFAALAASPLGQRLEILEILRGPVDQAVAKVVVTMPCLRRFVGSRGYVEACTQLMSARFRDRFVIEAEPGKDFLLDGVKGVSYRPPPRR